MNMLDIDEAENEISNPMEISKEWQIFPPSPLRPREGLRAGVRIIKKVDLIFYFGCEKAKRNSGSTE